MRKILSLLLVAFLLVVLVSCKAGVPAVSWSLIRSHNKGQPNLRSGYPRMMRLIRETTLTSRAILVTYLHLKTCSTCSRKQYRQATP